jgi:hypothetical protein
MACDKDHENSGCILPTSICRHPEHYPGSLEVADFLLSRSTKFHTIKHVDILDTSGAENASLVFKILGDFQGKYTLYIYKVLYMRISTIKASR